MLTRPIGASYADYLAVSPARGGLGWGTGVVALGLSVLIVICVIYLTLTHEDVNRRHFSLRRTKN